MSNKNLRVKYQGEIWTPGKIMRHVRVFHGHELHPVSAQNRIKKALKNAAFKKELLMPNRNIVRRINGKPRLPDQIEDAAEIKRRKEKFLALNSPEHEEMWAIQDRILSQY